MIKVPIFVIEGLDVGVYARLEDALLDLEPIASLISLPLGPPNREVIPCMMAMALLALLCGWWLVRGKGHGPVRNAEEYDEPGTKTP